MPTIKGMHQNGRNTEMYLTQGGSGDGFHSIIQNTGVPLPQRYGIDVLWSAQTLHDPDCYIVVRAFDSPESTGADIVIHYIFFMSAMTGYRVSMKTLFAVLIAVLKR